MTNIKTFEEHTTVEFSELLGKNWDAERIANNKKGLKSYMVINGEWKESLPNQSTYNKHIYATPEQIKELNSEYKKYKESKKRYEESKKRYEDLLKKYKKL